MAEKGVRGMRAIALYIANYGNLDVLIVFCSVLKICYVEVRIFQRVLEGPFDFEITRVDCSIPLRLNYKGI